MSDPSELSSWWGMESLWGYRIGESVVTLGVVGEPARGYTHAGVVVGFTKDRRLRVQLFTGNRRMVVTIDDRRGVAKWVKPETPEQVQLFLQRKRWW